MTTTSTDDLLAFDAERNGAAWSGVLHLFAALAIVVLLRDNDVVVGWRLAVFAGVEVALGVISLIAYAGARRLSPAVFRRLGTFESLGSALNYAWLAWLGPDIATEDPSKYLLMVTFIALTSITASNNAMLARRRASFVRSLVIVGTSYFLAYAVHGEVLFASFTVLWCLGTAAFSKIGYDAMLELAELRRRSDESARHDDLTGLLTRTAFFDELRRVSAAPEPWALALLDLDGFKAVNDQFGHGAGDRVLQTIAQRIEHSLPLGAVVGRLGGDEYAVLLPTSRLDVGAALERLLVAVGQPVEVNGRHLYVAGSIGWTTIRTSVATPELMTEADAAMYRSKSAPTSGPVEFGEEMRQELERSLELRQRFRTAIRQERIEFKAQPIVSTSTHEPVAVELLARWPEDAGDEVGADAFSRLADETGLAIELDRLALRAAADLLEAWRHDGRLQRIVVKANVSPLHLQNLVLARTIRDIVPEADRSRLGLEFVEGRLIEAAERHGGLLRELRAMGVTVSIDDFGTGYSSLAYLRDLPVSELKIDRSFVTGIEDDPVNRGLVRAMVDMAATLGLSTVAEGVETDSGLAMLRSIGVDAVQGFATGRPVMLDALASTLRSTQSDARPVPD